MSSDPNTDLRDRYSAAAERFCASFLDAESQHPFTFLNTLWVRLPLLYAAAAQLPEVTPDTDLSADIVIPVEERAAIERLLASNFGGLPVPWNVFDPFEEQPDPVRGTLADDLIDIYIDVKRGLLLEEQGASSGDVMWEWRFTFRNHWGRHALWAISTIHHLLVDNHVTQGDG